MSSEEKQEQSKEETSGRALFLKSLETYFSKSETQNDFRLTKAGLFVREGRVEAVLTAYQTWLKEATKSTTEKSLNKCRKRLIGDAEPALQYALDGKMCIPGYVLSGLQTDDQNVKIPWYKANLLNTDSYLHPRDPLLENLPGIEARLSSSDGLLLEFRGKKKWSVREGVVEPFYRYGRCDSVILEKFIGQKSALRDLIAPLGEVLKQVRPVPANQALLVPENFRDKKGLSFHRYRSLVFIADEKDRVISCYGMQGKGLSRFLREEFASIDFKKQGPVFRSFELPEKRSRYIAKITVKGKAILISPKVFYKFLGVAPKSKDFKKKLSTRYSLTQCLQVFITMIVHAKGIDERSVLQLLGRRYRGCTHRRFKNWIVAISEKHVLEACREIPKGKSGGRKEAGR